MLRACGVPLERATVGLIGCGNIGMHIVERLRTHAGVTLLVLESRESRRAELEAMGIRTWGPEEKHTFLALSMDALAINAAGGTLDPGSVAACAANRSLRVICGSENLVMPDPAGVGVLRDAKRIFAPTELGGMMGYLTAVEEYLSVIEGVPFDVATLVKAAERLEAAGYEATLRIIAGGHRETFEEAMTAVYAA
jgi:threonine dehydrogenase-like Zn-dependent dehydrogenase